MIFPKAKKIAKELGWHKTKDGVFGLYKDYFFNVGDAGLMSNPQFKYVEAAIGNMTDEQKSQIKQELEANKKTLKFTHFEMGDKRIFFQFVESFTTTKIPTVYALFDFLVALFKRLGISEQNKCHSCGTKDRLKYYETNGTGNLLCFACFSEIDRAYNKIEAEIKEEEKNYLTGFLGSFTFSAAGIIAWVLVAVYLETLASAMVFVIAALGLKGYEYFKGRQGNLTKYLIVLSNIICIIIANIATVVLLLTKEGLTMGQAIYEIQTNPLAQDMLWKNTMLSFVLAVFVWIWLIFGLAEKKFYIKPAEKMEG